jgi:hypothetical protein
VSCNQKVALVGVVLVEAPVGLVLAGAGWCLRCANVWTFAREEGI